MTNAIDNTIEKLFELLKVQNIMMTCAESCTGGLIAKTITDYAGSSAIFERGFVTYSNNAKHEMLGVDNDLFESVGAVSPQVAQQMASGAVNNSQAQIAVSCTGIAGPGGATENKAIGLVYIGIAYQDQSQSFKHQFDGNREQIREQTMQHAIKHLIHTLEA